MKIEPCDCKEGYVSHVLDGKKYCCQCFDEFIEHSGNIKIDLFKLSQAISAKVHESNGI